MSISERMVREAKDRPCDDCGKSYPYYVMQFDHLPQFEKMFDLAAWKFHSREEIRAEIAKCEVVCANCHAERTHRRSHGAEPELITGEEYLRRKKARPSVKTSQFTPSDRNKGLNRECNLVSPLLSISRCKFLFTPRDPYLHREGLVIYTERVW